MRRILPRLRADIGVPRVAGNGVLLVTAVFVVLAITASVLGVIGLLQLRQQTTPTPSWLALATAFLGLFANQPLSWIQPGQDLPASYEIARFLAPVSIGYVFVTSAAVILSEKWRLLRARLARGHSIVVGGGRRGVLLSRSLAQQGAKVVFVDIAASSEGVGASLVRRVIPLSGDPMDVVVLRRAGVERAAEIFAVADDGEVNASVVLTSRELRAPIERTFTCFAQVDDSDLYAALEARLLSLSQARQFRVSLIDTHQLLARALIGAALPPAADVVVIIGDGALATSVLLEVVRLARSAAPPSAEKPPSTPNVAVVGPAAESMLSALKSSMIDDAWRSVSVVARTRDLRSFAESTELLNLLPSRGSRVMVYVCMADDDASLKFGLTILGHNPNLSMEVVVCVREGSGFAKAFAAGPVRIFDDVKGALRVVATSDIVSDASQIREASTVERVAQALHATYLAHMTDTPTAEREPRNVVPWEDLASATHESNRAQAWHIGEKLRLLGCAILPLADSRADYTFTPEEIEMLAQAEHERWMAEKAGQGLTYGPTRTESTHPDLVPWEMLSEEAREKDRIFVVALPGILASEGYSIVKLAR
jgi:Trk K+ transport system NAD-binding subunit